MIFGVLIIVHEGRRPVEKFQKYNINCYKYQKTSTYNILKSL